MTSKSSQTHATQGTILILLSSLMFGSYGVWSKLMGDSFGVFYQGWTRALAICLLLLPILLIRKEIISIKKSDRFWLTIFLLFTSATQAPIYYAFTHMDIGSASLLFFVSMLLTMYVVGFTFLKERFTSIKVFSFLIALTGLYTIFSFSIEQFTLLAASMAVLNGIASGGEVAFSKKLTGDYSPLYVSFLGWLAIIPTNGIISLLLSEKIILPSMSLPWLWWSGYVLVSLVAFWFVIAGLKYVESSIGGLLGLLEVVFSLGFGILFFHEGLTPRVLIGGTFILIAASLPHLLNFGKK